jgi:hypothetical protein
MGIRDLLKKKDRLDEGSTSAAHQEALDNLTLPEFTFIRSDTHSQEVVFPPDHPPGYGEAEHEAQHGQSQYLTADGGGGSTNNSRSRLSLDVFRSTSGTGGRSRSVSVGSSKSAQSQGQADGQGSRSPRAEKPSAARRLSQRLHLQRAPSSSEVVPSNLPMIVTPEEGEPPDGVETQWEARATMLAMENEKHRSRPATPSRSSSHVGSEKMASPPGMAGSAGYVSNKEVDDDIQEAIRLHEAGDLSRSTAMFGRLADPAGANNPLSQVLYGLALRYVIVMLSCMLHGPSSTGICHKEEICVIKQVARRQSACCKLQGGTSVTTQNLVFRGRFAHGR